MAVQAMAAASSQDSVGVTQAGRAQHVTSVSDIEL